MTQLYKLTEQYRELQKVEDMDEQALADTLEGLQGEIAEKANAIAVVLNGTSGTVDVIDREINRLTEMKKRIQNRDKSMRDYLKTNMQATGTTNIKCDYFSITLAKGREIAVIEDESKLPDDYTTVKTTIAPDKKKILADLKKGVSINGATLSRASESLRIK